MDRYTTELAQRDQAFAALAARDSRLGTIRVLLFLAMLLFLFVAIFSDTHLLFGILAGAVFIVFFAVAIYNEGVRDEMLQMQSERKVLRRLLARLNRDWKRLGENSPSRLLVDLQLPSNQREVADDLDLFGEASLFQLVAIVGTQSGAQTLARWLAAPADSQVATARAAALDLLAPRRQERLRFYVTANQIGESTGHPDRFVAWAQGPAWLDCHSWLKTWSNVSVIATAMLLVATVGGSLFFASQWVIYSLVGLFALAMLNFAITAIFLGPAHEIFSIAMASRRTVAEYRELIAAARWTQQSHNIDACDSLASIHARLVEGEHSADVAMQALEKVAARGALRQSAATFLIYLPLQAFALWDIRVLDALEIWQRKYGSHALAWFTALGELEALMSLAALRDEYPHWSSPSWIAAGSSAQLSAESLGHPLLRDDARVTNDVQLGPVGSFLLVTGSNMSGKSTLLRSLGLNVALAGTGAPVCASSFSLPSIQLATSIRVRDNLAEGVSFYMAELHRLRGVVDQARLVNEQPDRMLVFLLDEILQGTNSRERQIAVAQVIETLVHEQAMGAISTHDLELADDETLRSMAKIVHFRETIVPHEDGADEMTFDYTMREGVSPTTNALRLLEIVGLTRKP